MTEDILELKKQIIVLFILVEVH